MLVAGIVLFDAVVMRSAIEFDNEFGGRASEIGKKAVDWMLAAKLKARELVAAQEIPESGFGRGLSSPQFAGAQGLRGRHGGDFIS